MKVLIILVWFTAISIFAKAQSVQDNEAVRQVIVAFQDDFNNGTFPNAHRYTTSDWVHINPKGGIKKGRDEVLKEVREVHQSFLKNVSMTIDSMHIRFVTPSVAVADVIHKMSTYELPQGVRHANERHIKTYIVVKTKGKWLLTHDQNTIVQGSNTASE